ncbi:hypothetical protein CAF53_19665 [Sphingobium sp. LB126]|uniref:GFA family protein n=1 Tax=Sphingobium sp. LB126 TaxID=1983755 RepID=UPI000C201AE2|nr:GFA family protein [Sphingobium sp. LB126]PJG46399.1 hypothetical protein CAF53_19665 [Sphingobium sp. LB126]
MDGSCLCGKITLRLTGEPELRLVCHCTHCQKHTGSAFSLLYAYPREHVEINGVLHRYPDSGDSGKPVDRLFCPNCGSSVAADAHIMPELLFLYGGALNDGANFSPVREIFCDSALPWVHLAGLERFARLPSEAGQ